jgi:hypothetical protein
MIFNKTFFYFYMSISGLLYNVFMFLFFVYRTNVTDFGDVVYTVLCCLFGGCFSDFVFLFLSFVCVCIVSKFGLW